MTEEIAPHSTSTFPPISVAFLLFPHVTQLDLTGPAQILSRLGNAKIDLVWKRIESVPTDSGFPLFPTASLSDVSHADILCIPGGFGTLNMMEDPEILDWVRHVATNAQWVTSVCTGSLILAAAGLLTGYRATCHWASLHQLEWFGAIPTLERTVFDRNRVTGGGVTSGIDFALNLISKIRGEEHAKFVQLSVEYDPQPPFDSGSPSKANPRAIATYHRLVATHASDRDAQVRRIANESQFN